MHRLLLIGLAYVVSPPFDSAQRVLVDPLADGSKPDISAGDLDGDGDLDVVVCLPAVGVAWVENLGGGAFGAPGLVGPTFACEVQLADLDVDGDLDVVTVSGWSENLGAGAFAFHPVGLGGHGALAVADLDGDGLLDMIVGQYNKSRGVLWYRNEGGGSFGAPEGIPHVASQEPVAVGLVAADLDDDGDIDVVASMDRTVYGGGLGWSANDGDGTFEDATFLEDADGTILGVDLDRDGDVDLLGCERWLENVGGSFVRHPVAMEFSCRDVAAADLDGDGDVDLVKSPGIDGTIGWYAAGGGGFGGHQELGTTHPTQASAVTAADLDGDGCIDVLYVLSDSQAGAEVGWFANRCEPIARDSAPTADTGATGAHVATAGTSATSETGGPTAPVATGDTASLPADTASAGIDRSKGANGCGCASGGVAMVAPWGLLLSVGVRRRRRSRTGLAPGRPRGRSAVR